MLSFKHLRRKQKILEKGFIMKKVLGINFMKILLLRTVKRKS